MKETLIKEILVDLENGNRTEEQLKWMKLEEFHRGHQPIPNMNLQMQTSQMMIFNGTSTYPGLPNLSLGGLLGNAIGLGGGINYFGGQRENI